jgi:hypothetical protein
MESLADAPIEGQISRVEPPTDDGWLSPAGCRAAGRENRQFSFAGGYPWVGESYGQD